MTASTLKTEADDPQVEPSLVLKAGFRTAFYVLVAGVPAGIFGAGTAMFGGRLVELRGLSRGEALFATTATIGCALLALFFGLLAINMTRDLLRRRILTVSHESIVDHRLKGFTIAFRHVRALEVVYGQSAPQAIRIFIDRLWPPTQSRFRVGCLMRPRQGQVVLSIGFLNRSEPDIVAAVLAIAEQHAIPIREAQVRRAVPKGRTIATS